MISPPVKGVDVKLFALLFFSLLSTETFALSKVDCVIDPKWTPDEISQHCWPNPAGASQIEELQELGRSVAGTDKIPARVKEICKGHVQCTGIFLWERNNRSELINPLIRLESDMRIQQSCNCGNGQKFKPCGYYRQYLEEVVPHSRVAICAAIGCEKFYQTVRSKREEYLRLRIIPGLIAVARNFPGAFIDPMLASDEYRAYVDVISQAPAMEPEARNEFKLRLCRKEKQDEIGSDLVQCFGFVDQLITTNRPVSGSYSRGVSGVRDR